MLTREQVRAVVEAGSNNSARDGALLGLLAYTDIPLGQILRLRWRDWDYTGKEIIDATGLFHTYPARVDGLLCRLLTSLDEEPEEEDFIFAGAPEFSHLAYASCRDIQRRAFRAAGVSPGHREGLHGLHKYGQ